MNHKIRPDPMRMSRSWGLKLLLLALVLAVVHHADHVLRVDHSGWPFLPRASPFTYSLAVYPVFLVLLLARDKPWARVVGTALLQHSARRQRPHDVGSTARLPSVVRKPAECPPPATAPTRGP